MKRTRSYTLADDVIAILSRKPNKSQYIERAVRSRSRGESHFDINDIRTRQLIAALHQREDCPKHIKLLLWDELCK